MKISDLPVPCQKKEEAWNLASNFPSFSIRASYELTRKKHPSVYLWSKYVFKLPISYLKKAIYLHGKTTFRKQNQNQRKNTIQQLTIFNKKLGRRTIWCISDPVLEKNTFDKHKHQSSSKAIKLYGIWCMLQYSYWIIISNIDFKKNQNIKNFLLLK